MVHSLSPENGPSAGGYLITIFGNNFASSGEVRIGGRLCRTNTDGALYSNSRIVCTSPAFAGGNLSVVIETQEGSFSTQDVKFSVDGPEITNITSWVGGFPTVGGIEIVIEGKNFGDESADVTIGGKSCPEIAWAHSHTTIRCILPPGQGILIDVFVSVGGKTSDSFYFSYDPPFISSIGGQNGSTLGGSLAVLRGFNFGEFGKVYIDGRECNASGLFWDHEKIECLTPPGEGFNLEVVIFVSGQSSSGSNAMYSYIPPQIYSISPRLISCENNHTRTITIVGAHFGISPKISVNSEIMEAFFVSLNRTWIEVTLPFTISGLSNQIEVIASNQKSLCASDSCIISVKPPSILIISGCSSSELESGALRCPIGGNAELTIVGFNFGISPVVKIQGKICINLTLSVETVSLLQEIRCLLPSNPAGRVNALVEVHVDNQVGYSRSLSYLAPHYSSGTLRLCNDSSSSLKELSSSGNELVCMDIFDLPGDLDDSEIQASYGVFNLSRDTLETVALSSGPFNCSSPRLLNLSTIQCLSSKGIGKNLTFIIQIRDQMTWTHNDFLSYRRPEFIVSSIREAGGIRRDSFLSQGALGDSIWFDVRNLDIANFPSLWSKVSITYKSNVSESLEYNCILREIQQTDEDGISTINCFTEQGEGKNLVFKILSWNEYSLESPFVYNYPQLPVIHSVSTTSSICENVGDAVDECNTAGAGRIIIFGDYFCNFSMGSNCSLFISVGTEYCTEPHYFNSSTLSCILPASTGKSLPISITQSFAGSLWISYPKKLISYASPSILSVSGCVDYGLRTRDCSRNNSTRIIIKGKNFGESDATVQINFIPCTNVIHDSQDPHRSLSCDASPGGALNAVILVFQSGGPSNFAVGFLSYSQCPPGSYRIDDSLDCLLCPMGKYAPIEGSSSCIACDAGRFSNQVGLSTCSACPLGKSSNANSTKCTDCSVGRFSSVAGSSDCFECETGKYADTEGETECEPCPAGKFTNLIGQSICTSCVEGTYSIGSGSSYCFPCIAGFYSNMSGVTKCERCDAGFESEKSSGSTSCSACPISSYSSSPGSSACFTCSVGSITNSVGATSCQMCAPGRYDSLENLQYCKNCSIGHYAPTFGSAIKCEVCLSGRYASKEGSSSCNLCPSGKFQPNSARASCQDCPIGTIAVSVGQTNCIPCESGYIAPNPGMSTCQACPAGKSNSKQDNSEECKNCPNGKFTDLMASVECSQCPVGKFAESEGNTQCNLCPAGTHQMNAGKSTCSLCTPGTYANVNGSSLCLPCQQGKYADNNSSSHCESCNLGKFQPFISSSTCLDCPQGKFVASLGSLSCSVCEPGRFARNTGQSTCERCERGTYQPFPEQQSCLLCPAGKFSFEESSECVKCGPRSVTPSPGLGSCISCPANSETNDEQTICICKAGYYAIERSVTIDNATYNSIDCIECPLGANCDTAGVRWETLETREGWWRADKNSSRFYQCQFIDHCTGGLSASCGGNREGVLCNKCKPGYEAIGSDCRKCAAASSSIAVFCILVLLICLILFAMFYVVLKLDKHQLHYLKHQNEIEAFSADLSDDISIEDLSVSRRHVLEKPSIEGAPSPSPNYVYKLKIILGFFQITVALALTLDLPLPSLFKSFISVFNIANFDLVQWTRFGCVIPITFLEKHLIVALFTPALVFAVFLIYLVPKYIFFVTRSLSAKDYIIRQRAEMSFRRGIRKFYKMILFIIFLIYPTVSAIIVKLYSCRTVEGVSYLTADFRVLCDSQQWKNQAKLNVLFVIMFPIAIPVCFAYLLFRNRHKLNCPETLVKIGFLYAAYSDDAWWFEIVDVVHKLILTSLLVFVPLSYRIQCGILVVLSYFLLFLLVRPYIRKGDDRLHGLVLTEIILILLGGYIYRATGKIDSTMDTVLSVLFIMITLGLMTFVILQVVSLVIKQIKMKKLSKTVNRKHSQMDIKILKIRADPNHQGVKFCKNPLAFTSNDMTSTLQTRSRTIKEMASRASTISSVQDPKSSEIPLQKISFPPETKDF